MPQSGGKVRAGRPGNAGGSEGGRKDRRAAWILAGAGLVAILAGYLLLSGGSITAAPLLLVLGYVVLVPLAILRS